MNDFEDILDDYLNFSTNTVSSNSQANGTTNRSNIQTNGMVSGGNSQALRQEVRVLAQPSVAYQNQLLNNKITQGIERVANAPYNIANKYLNSNLPGAKHLTGMPTNQGQSWANAVTAGRDPIATRATQADNLASKFVNKIDEKGGSYTDAIAKRAKKLNDPSAVDPLTKIYEEYKRDGTVSKQSQKYIKDKGIFVNDDGVRETRWNSEKSLKGTQKVGDYIKGGLGSAAVGGLVSGGLTLAQTHDVGEAAKSGAIGAGIGAGAYAGTKAIEKGATNLLGKGLANGNGAASIASKVLLGNKGVAEASKLTIDELRKTIGKSGGKAVQQALKSGSVNAVEAALKNSTKTATSRVAAKAGANVAKKAGAKVVPFVGGALTVGMAANDIRKDMQRSDQYWKGKKTGKASKWIRTILNGIAAAGGVLSCIPIAGQAVGMAVGLAADGGNMLGQAFNLWSTENEEVKTAGLHTQI